MMCNCTSENPTRHELSRYLDSGFIAARCPGMTAEGNAACCCLMNVPSRSPLTACCSYACVFITIGPYQATGSSIGLPGS